MDDSNNFSDITNFDSNILSCSQGKNFCRICFEGDIEGSPLISSCSCKGTIKYIHENCLKNWILSLNQDQFDYKCDICKYPLQMKIKYKTVISFKNLKKEICTILLSPYLTLLNSCFIFIIAEYFYKFAFDFSKSFIVKIISLICFMVLIYFEWFLLCLFFNAIKFGCFDYRVVSWVIICPDEFKEKNTKIDEEVKESDIEIINRPIESLEIKPMSNRDRIDSSITDCPSPY